MVINVEYNQLDPLLRASGYPDGDVNSETGYSPFPGNINQVHVLHNSFQHFFLNFLNMDFIPKHVLSMFPAVLWLYFRHLRGGCYLNGRII